jgi:hypothetical protein
MRRSALLTVAAFGGLVCLLGGSLLYSALQDTARTGTNTAESAGLPPSADIQLAHATQNLGTTPPSIQCGTFSENLTSGLFTLTALTPGGPLNAKHFCIKNVGSQPVTLSALVDELTDVDFDCTGDEGASGDATCGGNAAGELSSVLRVQYVVVGCTTNERTGVQSLLDANATTPLSLGSLAAGATGCFEADIFYPANTAATAVQTAQSDRVSWRFKFSAQA